MMKRTDSKKNEMKIIIKESNRDRLQKVLDTIQKRTTTRNISVDDLLEIIYVIEGNLGIEKTKMIGVSADVDYNAQKFPNAYKHAPMSTHVTVKKVSSGWALTNVYRAFCRIPSSRYILNLTDEAKNAIIKSKMRFRD